MSNEERIYTGYREKEWPELHAVCWSDLREISYLIGNLMDKSSQLIGNKTYSIDDRLEEVLRKALDEIVNGIFGNPDPKGICASEYMEKALFKLYQDNLKGENTMIDLNRYTRVCGKCYQQKSDDVFHEKINDKECIAIPLSDRYKRIEIRNEKESNGNRQTNQ